MFKRFGKRVVKDVKEALVEELTADPPAEDIPEDDDDDSFWSKARLFIGGALLLGAGYFLGSMLTQPTVINIYPSTYPTIEGGTSV